jgi:probable phosphoglycerate mutase
MELLLVRHARPEIVESDGTTVADPQLTAEGHAQAAVTAKSLAAGQYGEVTAVVCSTMRRAQETAEPLAEARGVPDTPGGLPRDERRPLVREHL